ncbi:MlaC/ttg2D family ABC transporter substrate-binding protein [Saccharospirillum salsuginis]|uniref:Phospholipid transport system substrate-binding protein n=1 Tax=Saccharospirillum salsuginis TaxID=418750 RepID=A0A918NH86_9GAMM|nr:ABC transporter substrate-binding protein [Saccharospirillum salsuginis]GGX70290.1 hypothetical protein GCM10007392_42430 [Saccharospirillum salsuginis]
MRAARILHWIVSVTLLSMVGGNAVAEDDFTPGKPASESVIEGVQAVLDVVKTYSGSEAPGDRQAYLEEVSEVLEPLVGYTVIVSRIMGDALDEASREQKVRFLNVFKRSMVNTYAGGMYNFGSYEVRLVEGPDDADNTVRNTRVHLEVISPEGQRYPMVQSVYYSRQTEDWKMQNVIFNGINLGVTFKTQFDELYRKHNGDLDATISAWEDMTEEAFDTSRFR